MLATMLKPGYKTTEFAVTVLASVAALVAALAGHLSPKYAALATSVSVGLYAVSRGLAKISPPSSPPTP
jgi:hypothetical protein